MSLPVLHVSRRAAARIRHGHVWVYRSDLTASDQAPSGSLVEVHDDSSNLLGSALYSTSSQIALRMLAPERLDPAQLTELVQQRLKTAVGYRRRIVENSDAFRVVFSEGDGLPGLIVDCYNDVLSTQVLTQAMDHAELRDIILRTLLEEFKPAAVVERVEPRIRELEQLPPLDQGLRFGDKTRTIFTMNGVRFHFSALEGQKTGAFLDQRENYAAAASYARGEALDVFCYHGGFALHLARVCSQVTAVDSSRPALEIAEQNEKLNPRDGPEIEWMEANAFDLLKDYSMAGRQYDTIVLDPPAFAKSRKALETAMRGYKELNLRALKMLRPGGVLVTCSCSFHVGEDDFLEMLRAAAFDARQSPKVIAKRGQSRDHPVLLAVPETAYLKCVILTV
ncbi:MAG TPA: class I SAM-dependent rRNA methyltransferase [Terriglobales bacterium]|nr:class I SAM-dependent rRNA methyltransferase [Terriglobales bacterium]